MRAENLQATVLKAVDGTMFASPAIGAPVVGSKPYPVLNGTTPTVVVLAGLKISPLYTGRPRMSLATTVLVSSSELKSPALKASVGVVLPKPGRTPERKRVQSILVKKNVLLCPL